MNISAPFIRRPIGTSLLALGVLIAGIVCYRLLSISALPQVNFPAIFVTASQPGADASTMATTVAAPLERHLGQVPGVERMRSRSSEGSMFVILFFQGGVNLDQAAQQVQAAINAAQPDLPSGLTSPPVYRKANPNDDPVLQIALTSDTEPLSELYDRASTLLAPRLSQLPGVSNVDVSGSAQPAVRVDVNLRALNAMGLSSNELRNALTAANVTSPLGFLDDGHSTMAVTANDQLHNAEDFANLIIAVRNGTPVRLKDVAHVYQGAEDSFQAAWFNGKPAIELDLFKRPDANIIDTVDSIKAALPGVRTLLPPGTKMTPYYDGTPTIRDSVREVQLTLLISLGMVVLTMALFLRRLAPTVIAAIAMPMSLAGAFIAMYLLHFTLDNLSLLALVIAIAFVVDDAIVMIENVIRHVDAGMPPREAALKGAREIGFTIVSITASLVAVFIPLMFAPGFIGLFFNEFTVTLVAAILVSAVVSLTLTPSLCAVFLRPTAAAKTTRVGHVLERFHDGMLNVYRGSLRWALRHPLLMSLSPLILIFVTVFLFGRIHAGLFPPQDTGLIWARASGGATLSFADMKARQKRITQMFLADPAVEYVGANLGSGRHGSSGRFSIQLKPLGKGRRVSTQRVVARLSAKASKFPDLEVRMRAHQDLWSGGGGGTSQGAQYSVGLKGNDLKQLQVWLPKLVDELKKNPIFRDVGSDVDESGLRQNIVIDRATASRLGVTPAAVDDALYNAFGQRQVSTIYSDTSEYQVVVNALPSQTATPAALDHVYVTTTNGTMIPISAVARQEPGLAPTQITHEDQFTTMDLSFNLAPGVGMGEGMAAVRKTIRDMRLPGDIQLNLGSGFRRLQESAASMPVLLLGAILAVYIVLGMLYESLIHPITIVSTIPSAGTGALAALLLAHMELSIVAMMALVLLIGLVKKNAIMMIDFALVAQREQGMSPRDAIFEACIVRFRPIMMTTMVAILAALPLAIGLGAGAELRRPLGVAVIGGLLISQSLTLLSTPAIYLVFTCLSERWKGFRARRRERRRQRRLRMA
ncbi:efflux RND transporter permease subunit [Oleiagrimonas sp. MCCC 1A03011]|uniref:efflux RND transporter permease subunit n=1 Tax=Oleiagrimonas sp. MCCC 1A03011 TaxID=1926883 RepID=UPI000DC48E03|nr:efflux RND transporter permease subunit [Oleiagrimonas sp. MCCC 1A03011]RAP58124.1 acriflavin resistance protein [Oleiagrimonas sp. MCCC 1A03011]